ncbi:MAG: aspartate kinase [Microscillaceae bacterium]|nr:aspartate kinase [Microscillaceae bacterium]
MKVYKFGGASLKSAPAIRNLLNIIGHPKSQNQLLVVVSAMAKTTNELEMLLNTYLEKNNYVANLRKIKEFHWEILTNLFADKQNPVFELLDTLMQKLQKDLENSPIDLPYDPLYDLIIGQGEIISSRLVHAFLQEQGISCAWVDARQLIRTDSQWREGNVDWSETEKNVREKLRPQLEAQIVITQGFIGANHLGEPLTLGREGSDFSAAIFAACLEADTLTIWKDVAGVFNGDPKRLPEAQLYPQLSYLESALMSKYGASVIHPKTIAPLARKNIRLYVKSFLDPEKTGTCISNEVSFELIPAVIFKEKQVLIRFKIEEFNFLKEAELSLIFQWVHQCHLRVNYLQKTATEVLICADNFPRRIHKLEALAQKDFIFSAQPDVELITILHPQEKTIQQVLKDKIILLESRNAELFQAIVTLG